MPALTPVAWKRRSLYIRHVPDEVAARLEQLAAQAGLPLSTFALQALANANRLGLRRHPSRFLWPRAWELRANLSAYDALTVALAEQLSAPLLTVDARLTRAPGLIGAWGSLMGQQPPYDVVI